MIKLSLKSRRPSKREGMILVPLMAHGGKKPKKLSENFSKIKDYL
jgi:hypothetical protein